ncbi:3-methyl-2-oxobutanoate hydroxymethyltransferase [Actinomyces bowdenii]|uniref:3-methyl-2-oxobutanoate hydroxymethyltransferase n=1 Tax=Actinomyces bowdenii TaxID=131109 RepID=A0A853EIA2_9ACTO|nr:3-methyl-2-oxobutanoate hydroxymethyltransferase [Actinomyces bowdenii]MBF0696855.1 3-methyl-2-oxobutanoate hydroxymethyltransferase [Actinomyces bowdenii]NYS69028.1 3-methyl-2-oxobutanoate hydroxymethyltransferase [Actinomyces bowdenii]
MATPAPSDAPHHAPSPTPATAPAAPPAGAGGGRPVRVHHLRAAKAEGTRLVMLTAYDAVTARILDASGVDMLLVGDSIGNVMHGHDSTLPVELDEMVVATRSVARTTERALVVADLPFGSYEAGPQQALASAVRLMKAGASAVKLEGGRARCETIRLLTQAGIPVMGHLGFTPQSVHALGGFRVQGRGPAGEELLADALAIEEAGVMSMVLEMVPEPLAARVTQALGVPTIGIGAGARTDGQVLVWTDMAGMTDWSPRFARRFAELGQELGRTASQYAAEVRSGSFPSQEHWFDS